MKWASLVHRATRVDASLQQAPDVLRMATRNGSAALGHETGQISVGSLADIILVNLDSPSFTPLMPEHEGHLYSHLVFAGDGSCVHTTIVNGQVLMLNREFTTIDVAEVLAKANEHFRAVVGRMKVPAEYAGL